MIRLSPSTSRKKPRFRSVIFEISFLYTSILGIILVIFSGTLYIMLYQALYKETDSFLEQKAKNISHYLESYLETRGGTPEALERAAKIITSNESERFNRWWIGGFERRWLKSITKMDLDQIFINLVLPNKTSYARSEHLEEDLQTLFLALVTDHNYEEAPIRFQNIDYQERKVRVATIDFSYGENIHFSIQVGLFQRPVTELILNWLDSILIIIPIILILTSFIGILLANKLLRPVKEITEIAKKISHEDLSAQVEIKKPYREMTDLIDEFNQMIQRLQKSFHHIEEFGSHVAHELKTPLTIIKGEAELALIEDRTPEEHQRTLAVLLDETDNMLKLIDDLLYLSRLDYQPEMFQFEKIDFTDFLLEIVEQAQFLASEKKIEIIADIPEETIYMSADVVHLRRLFYNLLDNALKFTPEKGKVFFTCQKQKHSFEVKIEDTGIGISEDDLAKIFDRFFRSDFKTPGNGLGLSMVYGITQIHKGQLKVTSTLGEGTCFHLLFPIA